MNSALHVLGSCGAWPEAGRACNGFVLEHEGFRVVLDLGYGTLPRLLTLLGSSVGAGLDAVVITHRHPDHMVDLHALFRARWFGRRGAPPLPLFAAAGVLETVIALEEGAEEPVRKVFDLHPLPAVGLRAGPFRLDGLALPHFVPNAGVRLSAPGLVVAYTGDTGPDPALAELAADTDLFIAEASDRDQQPGTPPATADPPLHLNAHQAGEATAAAGARLLLLTHFWPGNDRERSRAEAAAAFPGEVVDVTDPQFRKATFRACKAWKVAFLNLGAAGGLFAMLRALIRARAPQARGRARDPAR